jgi:hypothetical protein
MLSAYAAYYNETRPHLALEKDAPLKRAIQRIGSVIAIPALGGLHHKYVRIGKDRGYNGGRGTLPPPSIGRIV